MKIVPRWGLQPAEIAETLEFWRDALGLHLHDIEEVPDQKVRVAMA